MLKKLMLLLKVSRPVTWPVGFLLVLTGLLVAEGKPNLIALSQFILLTPLIAVFIFGLNDIHDFETDRQNKRKKALMWGPVLEKKDFQLVRRAAFLSAASALLISVLGSKGTTWAAIASLLFVAYAYSVPPLRLKEKPLIDSLSNGLGAVLLIMIGFSYGRPISEFPLKMAIAAMGASGPHALGAVMDYASDKKAGLATIATFFGKRAAAIFSAGVMAAILLFSGIKSAALMANVWLWLAISAIAFVKPRANLLSGLFKISIVAGIASIALFLYQQFYK